MENPSRRGFLASVGALAGASLIPNVAEAAQAPQGGWDLSFVDKFTGKHKQVFDVMDTSIALVVIKNWLDAWESVYGMKYPDVNAIGAIAGKGFVINASDEMYAKFPIGRLWSVNDASGQPATSRFRTEASRSGCATTRSTMSREESRTPFNGRSPRFIRSFVLG
jgi:hypothetical protein